MKLYKILYNPLDGKPYNSRPRFMRRVILPVIVVAVVLFTVIILGA